MADNVNHPKHYSKPGRKERIVEMEELYGIEFTAIFCLMNSYKYIYRAGMKSDNPVKQDIDKAKWYFKHAGKLIEKMRVLNDLVADILGLYHDISGILEG